MGGEGVGQIPWVGGEGVGQISWVGGEGVGQIPWVGGEGVGHCVSDLIVIQQSHGTQIQLLLY